MKFWQKKKTFDVSEIDQVYKVIYLGNVVTSWAKGEHTLEKPLTALWRNYCNNYANYHTKNDGNKKRQVQNKQILMKLTICNQGLKALTREFGLTEYWANRITFAGQNSNFPRVFAWIYRHEAKQKKQELRVHAVFVSNQSNVNKMISTLQQKINFALNEFKREKRLKENARKILSMNESLNLDDIEEDKTDSEFFNKFVNRLYHKIRNGDERTGKLKDDESSTNSSEKMNYESTNTSKNSTLDSKRITRNLSQGSLNSIKSKSSTSSRKSINYDSNLMPIRRQFLVKGLKNFKEPIERSRSAPKLSSINEEEFTGSSDEELNETYQGFFGKLINNNFVNYYNICEEEDDEEIIRELGLIANLTNKELNDDEIINENDKTLTEFDENDLKESSPIFDKHHENFDNLKNQLVSTINTNNEDFNKNSIRNHFNTLINPLNNNSNDHSNSPSNSLNNFSEYSDEDKNIQKIQCNGNLNNGLDESSKDNLIRLENLNQLSNKFNNQFNENQMSDNYQLDERISENQISDNLSEKSNNSVEFSNNQGDLTKNNYLFGNCKSPQFIIVDRARSFKSKPFDNKECDLHAKQMLEREIKLIEDLVLNF